MGRLPYCKVLYIRKLVSIKKMETEHRSQESGKGLVLLYIVIMSAKILHILNEYDEEKNLLLHIFLVKRKKTCVLCSIKC